MTKETMHRTAADNEYLHRDFHGALSAGIEYLHVKYGEDAVREYLWQFARAFYAPLTSDLQHRGLIALEEHFRAVYAREGGVVHVSRSENELRFDVESCPAVTHMRQNDYYVARLFRETSATVNQAICHGTSFSSEMLEYDEETGRCVQRFVRKVSDGSDHDAPLKQSNHGSEGCR